MAIRTVQIKGVLKTLINHQIITLNSNKCHFFESNKLSKSKKTPPPPYQVFYREIFKNKKSDDCLLNNPIFLFDSKIKSIQPKRIPKQNNPQKLYKSKFLTKRQQKSKQQIIRTKPIMNTLQRISKSNVFLLVNSSYCIYSNLVINIFGDKSKKTSDYLKKSFNQNLILDITNKIIIQFKIKNKIPMKIAFIPKLSLFTKIVINPTTVVIIVKKNNKKNVISNGITISFAIYQSLGIITTITNSIVKIIIITIAKINDITSSKLCFFISNITFTHLFKIKHSFKSFENKKTSNYLSNIVSKSRLAITYPKPTPIPIDKPLTTVYIDEEKYPKLIPIALRPCSIKRVVTITKVNIIARIIKEIIVVIMIFFLSILPQYKNNLFCFKPSGGKKKPNDCLIDQIFNYFYYLISKLRNFLKQQLLASMVIINTMKYFYPTPNVKKSLIDLKRIKTSNIPLDISFPKSYVPFNYCKFKSIINIFGGKKKTIDYWNIFYFPYPANKHMIGITTIIKPIIHGYIKKSRKLVTEPKNINANPIATNPLMILKSIYSFNNNCKVSFNIFVGTKKTSDYLVISSSLDAFLQIQIQNKELMSRSKTLKTLLQTIKSKRVTNQDLDNYYEKLERENIQRIHKLLKQLKISNLFSCRSSFNNNSPSINIFGEYLRTIFLALAYIYSSYKHQIYIRWREQFHKEKSIYKDIYKIKKPEQPKGESASVLILLENPIFHNFGELFRFFSIQLKNKKAISIKNNYRKRQQPIMLNPVERLCIQKQAISKLSFQQLLKGLTVLFLNSLNLVSYSSLINIFGEKKKTSDYLVKAISSFLKLDITKLLIQQQLCRILLLKRIMVILYLNQKITVAKKLEQQSCLQYPLKHIFYRIHSNPSSQRNPLFLINIFGGNKKTSDFLDKKTIFSFWYTGAVFCNVV